MVAALDIGNSTLGLCFFDPYSDHDFFAPQTWPHPEWQNFLPDLLDRQAPQAAMISCVASSWLPEILTILKKLQIMTHFVALDPSLGVDFSLYSKELGPDRIATALGAASSYPNPQCVVDMGTATTLSLIDHHHYQGGLIMPGIGTMFSSLYTAAQELPLLDLSHPPEAILGHNTQQNIQQGIFHLAQFGLSGIIQELRQAYPGLFVVGTGGWSRFFGHLYDFVDQKLIFKGLKTFYLETLVL
ncbi:MAG: hypothetical protein CVV50_00550 [Spirochaetae bacterium HGW-Spirochaetae-6]|nr:MAG: hypothetical protein CVV50_00550 [Spirochaetae bacterium HGW-Spirochaetae-6]